MNLYSRRLIGWAVGRSKSMERTMRALERAIAARGASPSRMFQSDRSVEYAAHRYQRLLQTHAIVPTTKRPYISQYNAHMASFFPSLKAGLLHRREVSSDGELIAPLAGYIDRFYGLRRLHSSLGYHSPIECEQLARS